MKNIRTCYLGYIVKSQFCEKEASKGKETVAIMPPIEKKQKGMKDRTVLNNIGKEFD